MSTLYSLEGSLNSTVFKLFLADLFTSLIIIPWFCILLQINSEWLCPRSTQNVSYLNEVNIMNECDESGSPTHKMWSFLLLWNFFWKLWRHNEKAPSCLNLIHCTKTNKKNGKHPNGGYFIYLTWTWQINCFYRCQKL